MLKELFGRPPFLRITRKATSKKVLADNRGAGRQLVDGRMVRGDLKDGGHPLKLVPRRMARQHFDNGTAQTPYIDLAAVRLALDDLWRHVVRRSGHGLGVRSVHRFRNYGCQPL